MPTTRLTLQKAKKKFEKTLKDYPMLGEIQLERELMEEI